MSFGERLGHSESGGRYNIRNKEGYAGKYQFGDARLQDYMRATGSAFSKDEFQASPALQEQVYKWHEADIDKRLGDLVGREVNGQVMDQNALRAVAHLGGIGGARKYVTSGGAYNPADSNGTALSDYARKLGGGGGGNALSGHPAGLGVASASSGGVGSPVDPVAAAEAQRKREADDMAALIQRGTPKFNALDTSAYMIDPSSIFKGWR